MLTILGISKGGTAAYNTSDGDKRTGSFVINLGLLLTFSLYNSYSDIIWQRSVFLISMITECPGDFLGVPVLLVKSIFFKFLLCKLIRF